MSVEIARALRLLFERLRASIENVHKKFQVNITLEWVQGHSGVNRDERADLLAIESVCKEQNVPVDQTNP